MKMIIAGLVLVAGVACAGSRATSVTTVARGSGDAGPTEAGMAEARGYLLLKDGSIHPLSDGAPSGLHVVGTVADGSFQPQGDVVGEGPLGESGSPGWMELVDGSFHGDQTARPPFPPYLKGYRTRDGEFRPKSRQVTY